MKYNITVEIEDDTMSVRFKILSSILSSIEEEYGVKLIDVEEAPKSAVAAVGFPGHTTGCRVSRSGTCTCGPVPR